jgi:[acyl-carrier-protein] S-malonyltransferase
MSHAFLFPGQGAQHIAMGKTLSAEFPAAKALFDQANDILGFDLATICFEGPEESLNKTNISQPALFVCSLAALEKLKAEQPEVVAGCQFAAGLSLGEYTALTFAGAMSFEDGLRVVRRRGEAMQAAADATDSGMVTALFLSPEQVDDVVSQAREKGGFWTANLLCKGTTVLSGETAACDAAEELINVDGRAKRLEVAGAFHTKIMAPALAPLAEVLESVEISTPRIPVISNVDAEFHTDPDEIRAILGKQVVNPVLWEDCMQRLLNDGVDHFYEIGPGRVLRGLCKRIARKVPCDVVNDSPLGIVPK